MIFRTWSNAGRHSPWPTYLFANLSAISTRETQSSDSGRSAEQLKAIRYYAGKNCFDASAHGRIKADVIDAFDAAN
ncbi:Lsr2 family DNA-binding protein [Rhodococcus globerulus]|uniref:Histone-like nucleoid-structuring protein Lsr2 n=1 Tax=Rhodococcus globerulus TaxID=33008 RepID=A0ABU4C464_RHOGO|nr:histone-like nucleoid-structuring protein Lsr2 [Rhodococcus globerulus]MDV6271288.1 histone-like nucleoid-structuring protein Lsr2 [Rhodococcus globerulus]